MHVHKNGWLVFSMLKLYCCLPLLQLSFANGSFNMFVHLVMDLILPNFKGLSWIVLFHSLISFIIVSFWMWCQFNACFLRTEKPAVLNYDIL